MKKIVFFCSLFILMSCATESEVVQGADSVVVEDTRLVGKVRIIEKEECPFFLETYENGKAIKMYPVNLEDRYKIEGVKIKFDYELSRAMQPENCSVDKVVSLNNVTQLR